VAYDIYRNNVPLASLGPATNYSDNTTAPSTVYQYVVRARDIVGHQSDPSNPASATTPPDTVRPSTPSGFNVVAFSSKQVNLSWKASTDNVGVTGYQVYRNSAQLVSIAAVTNYADTTVSPSTSYSYKVRTFDAAGNLSSFSSTKNVTTPSKDSKAPSTPSNLVASAVSATQINLRWKASTDNRKVIGYEIYREGTLRSSIGAVTNFSDTAVLPLMTYHYQVRARDADGNLSGFSNQATASTPADAQKPSPPSQLTALATNATRVDLSWKAASDNVAVIAYDLYRDGSPLVSVGVETNYADNAVLPSTNYNYEVRARDAAGNLSDPSNTALVNTPADTDKPSAPSNLNATAVSSFQVDLAWNASTDNVAVTGYNIYRDGVSLPVTVIGTNYTDNTVLPSTNYNYEVRARDAADNLSDPSNTAPVNTPEDSGSPSAANYDPSEPVLAPTKTAISTGNGYRELVSFDQLNLEHWLAFGRHREDDS
jgi:chitodextrinase